MQALTFLSNNWEGHDLRRLPELSGLPDCGVYDAFQNGKDLELRGAGNVLGPQQSGNIAAVGYDMYCRLLKLTVERLAAERDIDMKASDLATLDALWDEVKRKREDG